jgi:hypothetical protein
MSLAGCGRKGKGGGRNQRKWRIPFSAPPRCSIAAIPTLFIGDSLMEGLALVDSWLLASISSCRVVGDGFKVVTK